MLVLERAGQALTLARMAARDQEDLLYRARAGFLQALIGGDVTEEQARERAVMLGLAPAEVYLPLVVHVPPDQDRDLARLQLRERALMDDLLAAARPLALSVVAAALRTGSFAMLLGLSRRVDIDEALTRVVERAEARSAHRDHSPQESPELVWTVGVAAERPSLTAAAAGIEEATQVARTVAATPTRQRPYYRFADIRLPGLMALLADDPRVRTFAEAELAPLLAGQPPWGLDLLGLYLDHGGNKSEVSRAGHLSRQALYARLHRLEEMLGVSLDEPESRAALHVALMWKRGHAVGAGRS